MIRPPLANLFAIHDADPAVVEAITGDLERSDEFAEVWRPAPGWVVAAAPLPGGKPDGDVVRGNGLAFAEGRDILTTRASIASDEYFEMIAELTDISPERLVSLPSDFGFIRFRMGGSATVVRSCGGLVPFYLWKSGSRVAVSTRLGDFVRYLPDEFHLDPLVNAVWTSGHAFFPDRRTFLSGVSILDRGYFARIEPDRPIAVGRYWNPRPHRLAHPTPARAREHVERLRALLIDKLTRDLDPEGGNLLTLSGGVDSSSLGALAAGEVGRKVWTLSFLPAPKDHFEHEMAYIRPLASRYGFERQWSILLPQETRLELLPLAPRILFPVMHPALCILPRINREAPVRVLFGGEFADEVCGSVLTFPDWTAHTSLFRLIGSLGKLPTGPRDLLRWVKHRSLSMAGRSMLPFPKQLPSLVHPEVREEYRMWFERRRREAVCDQDPLRYLSLLTEQDGFVVMNWEATSALGIRRSFPFFNREAIELAFECHPAELIGPGTKKLLRTALQGDVPRNNLQRPDKGQWAAGLQTEQVSWQESLPEVLKHVVRPDWYPTPPKLLDCWEACRLVQLMLFVDAQRTRRRERDSWAEAKVLSI